MPLSEEELRLLEQMERALSEEDPKFASTLRGTEIRQVARRKAILAGVAFVVGIAVLMGGAILAQPVVGVVGFVIMLASATYGLTVMRGSARGSAETAAKDTKHTGFQVVDGGKKSRPQRPRAQGSFMERMEERWRKRRDQGF